MRKGISPIVASVLLIAITMAIAAILANWASTYTTSALPSTNCIGGSVSFVSSDDPKWTTSNTIRAVIEPHYVALKDFKFVVIMKDDTVYTYPDATGVSLQAGIPGKIETDALSINKADIKQIQVVTSCSDVKTELTTIK